VIANLFSAGRFNPAQLAGADLRASRKWAKRFADDEWLKEIVRRNEERLAACLLREDEKKP